MAPADDAHAFLAALFGEVDPARWVYLWTLTDRQSRWHHPQSLDAMSADAVMLGATADTYVGAAFYGKSLGPRSRGAADKTAGITALWADIDIAGDAHKKTSLPPDADAATAMLESVGAAPTMLVHSGHGLQAWWCFNEPLDFATVKDRTDAASLSHRWGASLARRSADMGYAIDSVHDLSRIMRVPGTLNHKGEGKAVPVVLLSSGGPRYEVSDLEPFMLVGLDELAVVRLDLAAPINVDTSAARGITQVQVDALRESDETFSAIWDGHTKYSSASERDLAMANVGVMAGWSDQQILDTCVELRRRSGNDTKLNRLDYWKRTLAKARSGHSSPSTAELIEITETLADERSTVIKKDGDPITAAESDGLAALSGVLKMPITRVVVHPSSDPTWRFETATQSIIVGNAELLFNFRRMKARLFALCGVVLPAMKNEQWDIVVRLIGTISDEEDIGDDTNPAGELSQWLGEWLALNPISPPGDEDFRRDAFLLGRPYEMNHGVVIPTTPFLTWLNNIYRERMSFHDLGVRMAMLRGRPVRHRTDANGDGVRSQKRGWWVPYASLYQ